MPDLLPWMESADAKFSRAREHLDILNLKSSAFFESTKRIFQRMTNEQRAWIVYHIQDSFPPVRLGVLLGECLCNRWSALDNLICGLI